MSIGAYLEQKRKELSLKEALQERKGEPVWPEERYKRLGDYDAVLRAHCRLNAEVDLRGCMPFGH
jgi:hypothetical protein